MRVDPSAPADTRAMGIVHRALLRDLTRARVVLAAPQPPPGPQRKAVAEHLRWMMRVLHMHHTGEDEGLYPWVRERNPAAAELLDVMDADHHRIGPGISAVDEAAAEYGSTDLLGRERYVLAAIDMLEATLIPHLRREEDEMMPVVSATLTNAEWHAWDQQYNIKPKSLTELGREGHWLIDDVSAEDREVVVGLVPAIPRFILLHGFAGSYRRHRDRCWGPSSPSRFHIQKEGRTEVTVAVDPDLIWDVVRDVRRVGEWSLECTGAEWLDGATEAVPGARFHGRNRAGMLRWGRVCEIVEVKDKEMAWRTVPTALYPDVVEWRMRISAVDDGAHIEQTYHVVSMPPAFDTFYATINPGHRDRREALNEDLRRLAAVAASTPATHTV